MSASGPSVVGPQSAGDVARNAGALYGDVDWSRARGLIHVAAVARDPKVGFVNIEIGEKAPRSHLDRFVLGLARARAEAILTSGRNLRREPELSHRYGPTATEQSAFERWRSQAVGLEGPPVSIVWTRGARLPHDHPLLVEGSSCRLVTSTAAAADLARSHPERSIEGRNVWDLWMLASGLVAEGTRTLLVECGPSTSRSLYESGRRMPVEGQELLLSIFEGRLDPIVRGEPFVAEEAIVARLGGPVSERVVDEASGRWRFRRYRRERVQAGGLPAPR